MKKFIWTKKYIAAAICLLIAISLLAFTACGDNTPPPAEENAPLASIEVTTIPTTTTYFVGDKLSTQGMVVTARYTDGKSAAVTDFTWSPDGALTVADQAITVTYTENEITATATQEIRVRPAAAEIDGIVVKQLPEKLEYNEGDKFDPKGIRVVLHFNDDTEGADVTSSVAYNPFDYLTPQDTEITVSYNAGIVVYSEKIDIKVNESQGGVDFGGGTYKGLHTMIIAPESAQSGDSYTLADGFKTKKWDYNGTYADSPFGRAQMTKGTQWIDFKYDFSALDDVSKAGFSANMIGVRARTLVQIAVGETVEDADYSDIGYADETGDFTGVSSYRSDYKELVTALRGREVGDKNLYNYFWQLGASLKDSDSKIVHIRFGYTDACENVITDQSVGADVIDHVCFYDSLELNEKGALTRIEITNAPIKTAYKEGEFFDGTGMIVNAYYANRPKGIEITDYKVSPAGIPEGILSAGIDKVTVTFAANDVTKTAEQAITVIADPAGTFGGGTWQGKHQITLGRTADADAYNCQNKQLKEWKSMAGSQRLQTKAADQNITFTLDFSGVADKSHVGCSLNLSRRRAHSVISVSTDGETWTVIGHAEKIDNISTITADYNEHMTEFFGFPIKDDNLYSFYYGLGEYIGSSDIIYVRCGYDATYNSEGDKGFGADVMGYVNFYDELIFTPKETSNAQ